MKVDAVLVSILKKNNITVPVGEKNNLLTVLNYYEVSLK